MVDRWWDQECLRCGGQCACGVVLFDGAVVFLWQEEQEFLCEIRHLEAVTFVVENPLVCLLGIYKAF